MKARQIIFEWIFFIVRDIQQTRPSTFKRATSDRLQNMPYGWNLKYRAFHNVLRDYIHL
jgi:hypothetical protein